MNQAMTPGSTPLRRRLLEFVFWTAVALFFTTQAMTWMSTMEEGRKLTMTSRFMRQLPVNLFTFYLYWATLPLYRWLKARFPLDGDNWPGSAVVHAVASVVTSAAHLVVVLYMLRVWYRIEDFPTNFNPFSDWPLFAERSWDFIVNNIHLDILTYFVIIGIFYLMDYYRRSREREVRAAQLERELSDAQLRALRMQLNPHFLFNTLNSIASLMHVDVEAADSMLVRLSDLLRRALEGAGAQEVTLRQELEFLKPYLEIERIRFQDRMTVDFEIPDAALEAKVPNLILQPLVENAIKHGLAPQSGPGHIGVRASLAGDTLTLEVNDNGRGLDGAPRPGVGLANTRERLERLYGARQSFDLVPDPAGGLTARITLPFQT